MKAFHSAGFLKSFWVTFVCSLSCGFFLCGADVQLVLIIDASSSTDDELETFVDGIATGLSVLKTNGNIELTIVQFSAEAAVIFGPQVISSEADRAVAVARVLAMDPEETDVPPFIGGTNIEDGFLMAKEALTSSANANAPLQILNMLTDGHPTSHNHLGLADVDENARHQRGQTFAKAERDALITAGIDLISFEALGASPADIDYLKTLTFPGDTAVVTGPSEFPSPIESQGFIVPVASVLAIGDTLIQKFTAAGFRLEDLLTYLKWAEEVFGTEAAQNPDIGGPLADPDRDGLTNAIEYGLGSNPLRSDSIEAVWVTLAEAQRQPMLCLYRNPRASDLSLYLESSRITGNADWERIAERTPNATEWMVIKPGVVIMERTEGTRVHVDVTDEDFNTASEFFVRVTASF